MGLPSCGQHGLAVKHDEPTREEEEEKKKKEEEKGRKKGMIIF